MARFHFAKTKRIIIRGALTSVIPNPQGIPVAVNTPAKEITIASGIFDTNDQELIERIRRDEHFGIARGMYEITEEEQEAIKIREQKNKEADELIKEAKKKKLVK